MKGRAFGITSINFCFAMEATIRAVAESKEPRFGLSIPSPRWTLQEPNTSPPGVCCNAQNVHDPTSGRYIRFPLFSGGHGWQWQRELYLNDSSVWTYDLGENRWRNMRPLPRTRLAPYRCDSWDSDRQLVVVFGGEGGREGTVIYDPWRNNGAGLSRRPNPILAAEETWPTMPPGNCMCCSVRSSAMIRTLGPTMSRPMNGGT